MEKELIILVEKRSRHLETFLDILSSEKFISFRDLRKNFPNTSAHELIQNFIFKINRTLKSLNINTEFIGMDLVQEEDKTLKGYKIPPSLEIKSTDYHHVIIVQNAKKE